MDDFRLIICSYLYVLFWNTCILLRLTGAFSNRILSNLIGLLLFQAPYLRTAAVGPLAAIIIHFIRLVIGVFFI